ncbi:addiction module toxin, HicA family [candidate division KSB1 bacterium]|jgi:predicted RNA binding protein YcfA (HicA-like mRNA interferase family)|nr:addiction module toxin, HicA family [candidate division KSB1 bacterium]
MSRIEKILKSWQQRPVSVPKNQVLSVLDRYGFDIEKKSGSHIIVRHSGLINKSGFGINGEFTIPVKGGQSVKGFYLKRILEAIAILEEVK